MDPLSITASIIGIIGGVSATYKTIRTIKGLPKAFDEVQNDLPLVLRTLRSAQDRLCDDKEITEDERNDVVAILQPSHDKAQELQRVFDEVKNECENDKDAKDWAKVRSVYHKALRGMKASRVEQLMKDILGGMKKLALSQAFKSVSQNDIKTLEDTLEKAINDISKIEPSLPDSDFANDGQIHASQHIASGGYGQQISAQGGSHTINSGKYVTTGSGHTISYVETMNVRENLSDDRVEVQRCLRDLRVTDPYDDKKRIEEIKGGLLADSYHWILDNTTFKQWHKDQNSQLLWVKGDPGKGKTMLLCGVINELRSSIPQTTLLSYFFCQATDSRLNSAAAVLRGLLYMLVHQQPSLISHVRKKHDYAGKSLFEDANAWVALTEIFADLLRDASLSATYLIIDALDECVTDLPKLLSFIAKQSSVSSHVKWIVSSRNWPAIEEELERAEHKTRLSLELNAESVAAAVNVFIQQKVCQLAQEKRYTLEMQDAVLQHLTSKANDTFLWVALVCQDLKTTPKWNVLKKLAQFPRGLDSLYKRMVQQTSESDSADMCLRVLAVTAILYRPVAVAELAVLTKQLADFIDDLESVREIIGLCGSFLTLRDDTIYFVHQSAKDFLVTKASNEVFLDGVERVHRDVFAKSLTILHKTLCRDIYNLQAPGYPIGDAQPPLPDPLAVSRYPCVYWMDHFCDSRHKIPTRSTTSQEDTRAIGEFIEQKYLYWLEALSLCRSMAKGIVSMTKLWHLVQGLGDTDTLNKIVYDARRLIMYHKEAIENYPLQAYVSALSFSPADSLIRRLFQHEELRGIVIKPAISNNWSACLQTLEGHSNYVTEVAFSHDSTRLASASSDRTVKIWDTSSGMCVHTLKGHSSSINSVAFSHDSTQLASASSDRTVKIWDASSGTCVHTLEGHSSDVDSVAFSYDSTWLASASYDSTIKIWDASSGMCVHTLEGHRNYVTLVAFSHNSIRLASASLDSTVKIWNVSSGTCTHTPKGHSSSVNSVAFSHDSTQLASASLDRTVKIWDASSGTCVHTLNGHGSSVNSVTFSHDSTRLASASRDSTVKIWDTSSGTCIHTLKGHRNWVTSVTFSHDSTRLASASRNRPVKIWDASNGTCMHTLEGHRSSVNSVAFSHDSTRLASASSDRTVKIWDTSSGMCVHTLKGHSSSVNSVAFSHDSTRLASASLDRTVKIWDASIGTCVYTLDVGTSLSYLCFDSTSTFLRTEMGTITISSSHVTNSIYVAASKPHYQGAGISLDGNWVMCTGSNVLWIPSEYRPLSSAVSETQVGIGVGSGRVWLCKVT